MTFEDRLHTLGLRDIAAQAARRHGAAIEELHGRSRAIHIVAARVELIQHLRGIGWSYPAIGRLLNRDHTTIMSLARARSVWLEPTRIAG